MPTVVFYGIAIGSVGGPLAIVALILPNTLANTGPSSTLITVLGSLAFIFPVIAWSSYARRVASAGGLYGFVEAAAGTNVARLHAAVWIVSYFLYLPATVPLVTYGVLPTAFPGIGPYRALLTVGVPALMVVGLMMWRLGLYALTAAVAVGQVVLVGVLAGLEIGHSGNAPAIVRPGLTAGPFITAALAVSLLFVCASLPFYLATEVRKATAVTSRALPIAVGVGAACAVAGAVTLSQFPTSVLSADVPVWSMGRALSGRGLADVLVLFTAVSVMTLVLLEYVALTRLLPAMGLARRRNAELGVGVAFVASCALTLINPDTAYEKLVTPALIALYLALVMTFLVYPWFRQKHAQKQGQFRVADFLVAAAAAALMGFGLYRAVLGI